MNQCFVKLFGQPEKNIKPLCILTPFLSKGLAINLGIKTIHKGKPYTSGNNQACTLIETRIGPAFAGDAALLLKETPCRRIVFIGACGALDKAKYPIGSIVVPDRYYALDSFQTMLSPKLTLNSPIKNVPNFPNSAVIDQIPKVCCASIGSIVMETSHLQEFQYYHIDVLDMEYASVMCAASHIDIPAMGLLYVTDIVGKTSPFSPASGDQEKIRKARQEIACCIKTLF